MAWAVWGQSNDCMVLQCMTCLCFFFVYCCEFINRVSLSKNRAISQITHSCRRAGEAMARTGDTPSLDSPDRWKDVFPELVGFSTSWICRHFEILYCVPPPLYLAEFCRLMIYEIEGPVFLQTHFAHSREEDMWPGTLCVSQRSQSNVE